MTKFLKSFAVIVTALFAFAACASNSGQIESMTFSVTPNGEGFYGSNLTVMPDYEARTLDVKYVLLSSEGEAGDELDVGEVGGEFFDRFETVTELINAEGGEELLEGEEASLIVTVDAGRGSTDSFEFGEIAGEDAIVQPFYEDLVTLFSEDTY